MYECGPIVWLSAVLCPIPWQGPKPRGGSKCDTQEDRPLDAAVLIAGPHYIRSLICDLDQYQIFQKHARLVCTRGYARAYIYTRVYSGVYIVREHKTSLYYEG